MRRASPAMLAATLVRSASSLAAKARVVVLHGKGGSGPSQRFRFQAIEDALPDHVFEYPTAPHALDGGGAQWWTLPPGVRSFQATEYGGIEASLELLAGLKGADVLWGHSQGAILLGFAAALGREDLSWLADTKLILNGASWPKPYAEQLEAGVAGPETLHVLGSADDINPPDQARRLAACFAGAEVHVHDGGHYVPADEASLAIYREFLQRGAARSVQLPSRGDAPQAMIENTLASFANGDVEATLARIWHDLAGDTFLFYYRHEGFEEFLKDARETADEFPTSFYGNAIYGRRWSIVRGWEIAGGEDGWIGTAIVETIASDGRLRNWIWELRKRRRPPHQGTWYIESIGSSDADGTFDVA
mmetsp:Transcript_310/g.857  ORF Transcript_310/g.857 Transcript_310/m.857 type:complete len:362 (-) Transcript_310:21-1106(-)